MLDKKTYKLLKYISNHPGCKFADDTDDGNLFYFVTNYLHYPNAYELTEALNILHDFNFIATKLPASSKDKKHTYLKTTEWREELRLFAAFYSTPHGLAYVQQRKHDNVNFWVPYSLTTLIALLSLILNLLRL